MTSPREYKDDPTPTYRGYRRQALYCLYRLFDDALPANCVLQPEGIEDLSIYDQSGNLIEAVQVKDYSSNLSASTFKPHFYKRISPLCAPGSKVAVTLASFGGIGEELANAIDNSKETPKRAIETLTKKREVVDAKGNKSVVAGLSVDEANAFYAHVRLDKVSENELTTRVIDKLKATMTAGDPVPAFENLMWWLISSAEHRRKLTRGGTIEKIAQLGRFLTQRAAHEHEWNVSIKPVGNSLRNVSNEQLKREFFQGGRVREAHVLAGLDVPRVDALHQIHSSFQQSNVVILHAASGQGKTTLAYRYLLDWSPADFRYKVEQAADLQHARRMAVAIAGHAKTLDVPTIIYVDVRPGDLLWVELVRELSESEGIRVLVTVREEDWFRARLTWDAVDYADLSVAFTEETAKEIFDTLRTNGYGKGQLDFTDAWSQIGGRKTLFEFVYLATQNERLAEKIRTQIAHLKDQVNLNTLPQLELHLLRLVAVASAYEAKLNLKSLVAQIGIPEPTRTLQRFANEYLLRTSEDGQYVEGFHAVRSEIIARELTDEAMQPRGGIEATLLPLLVEQDLANFLLCAFSRNPTYSEQLLHSLSTFRPKTWMGVRGICIALLWLGLKQYAEQHAELVEKVRQVFGSGWWFVLDWDLAQIRGKAGFDILRNLRATSKGAEFAAQSAEVIQRQQLDKDRVFVHAQSWLRAFVVPNTIPAALDQYIAIAEVLFWMGHIKCVNSTVAGWLDEDVISKAWIDLPIHLFSDFAVAVQKFNPGLYKRWLDSRRNEVETRLRTDCSIVALVEEDGCLVAHFVIDIDQKASELRTTKKDTNVNDLAVERVEILSRCLPGFERYGASGHGHRSSWVSSFADDSHKRMPVENISIPWLPAFNALSRGVVELSFRPKDWEEYFSQVRSMREQVIATFKDIRAAATGVLSKGSTALRQTESWSKCKDFVSGDFFLPIDAVDEWGYLTESRASGLETGQEKKFSAISTLEPFNKAINEYTRTVRNFVEQSLGALILVPYLRSAKTDKDRGNVLRVAKDQGIDEQVIRLSTINGFSACTALQQLHFVEEELYRKSKVSGVDDTFRGTELSDFIETIRTWSVLCYPEQIVPKAKPVKSGKRAAAERIELQDCLRSTIKRLEHALRSLASEGINARIVSQDLLWDRDTALWITFDSDHPLRVAVAIQKLWTTLVDTFRPDRDKTLRMIAIGFFWKRIVLIPLVNGKSIEAQAYANMGGAVRPLDESPAAQLWQFFAEVIPATAWEKLQLQQWERSRSWEVFDGFASSYTALFQHIDHLSDLTKCGADIDETGQAILCKYLRKEQERTNPLLQETFDSCARVLSEFPELDENILAERGDIVNCMQLFIAMKDAMYPKSDFDQCANLTLFETADWRDRLKEGFNLLGTARCFWVADSLGLKSFELTDQT